jgi:hypothetical protein
MRAASKCEVTLKRAQHFFFDFGGTFTIKFASRKTVKPKEIQCAQQANVRLCWRARSISFLISAALLHLTPLHAKLWNQRKLNARSKQMWNYVGARAAFVFWFRRHFYS